MIGEGEARREAAHYDLSNAGLEVQLEGLVRVRFARHRIEKVFEASKQE